MFLPPSGAAQKCAIGLVRARLWMALVRRAQSETASAGDAEVVPLASRIDHHPVAVNESLRVHHSRFRASQRAVVPNHRFCSHDHPVARDPPWPTRQPPSGLDRGLLAAFVLSRFSLPGLVRLCPGGGEGQDSSKRKRYAARASIVTLFRKRTEMVRRHEVYVSNPYDELSEFPCRYPCQPGQFLPQRL